MNYVSYHIMKITGDQRICCAVALFSAQPRKKRLCIARQCAFSMSCLRALLLINPGNQELEKSYTHYVLCIGSKRKDNHTLQEFYPSPVCLSQPASLKCQSCFSFRSFARCLSCPFCFCAFVFYSISLFPFSRISTLSGFSLII